MYIELKDLVKVFDQVPVLRVDHLTIARGEVVSVIGKNGSGKSTLIKILCGLLYQDQGTCRIGGLSNQDPRIRQRTKLVLESGAGYYDYLTAMENIRYFLALNKVAWTPALVDRLEDLMQVLEFTDHQDKKVSDLSQGNRQKLSLMVSLLTEAEVICLDEPTNGLDIRSMNILLSFVNRLAVEEGKTILFTSHDLAFMKSLNARLLLLDQGRIVLDQASGDLFSARGSEKTLIDLPLADRPLLQGLAKTRYEFTPERIRLTVYDEGEKEKILAQGRVLAMSQAPLTAEDIYFKVISHV